MSNKRRLELPPTGGLPVRWRDWLPQPLTLESRLQPMLGAEEMLLTCSGTAALVIALSALKQASLSPSSSQQASMAERMQRREVVVPGFTCPLVVAAIAHCGLQPRLCDLRRDHFDMDPGALAALCSERTLAVIPTHLGGRLADVETPMRLARSVGAWTIEDAAQAVGARHRDGIAAGLSGDFGIFSFAAGKGLTLFEGGALVTQHRHLRTTLAQTAESIAPRNLFWDFRRGIELLGYTLLYHPRRLDWAYGRPLRSALKRGDIERAAGDAIPNKIPLHRLGAWRRNVGARAAGRLPAHLEALQTQAQARLPALRAIDGLTVFEDHRFEDHSLEDRGFEDRDAAQGIWPVFLALMPDRERRDRALAQLWPSGLGVGRMFAHALPGYGALRKHLVDMDVPNAHDFAARSLIIGNSLWLDDTNFKRIVDVLREACR